MGLFFEKASKQGKFQRVLTRVIIVYLLLSLINSLFLKIDFLLSITQITDTLLLTVVFIWLIFFVKNKNAKKQ